MDIQMLGAWGELLGGLAVVASLVFVGIQVRHGAEASRAATRQAIADSMIAAAAVSIDAGPLGSAQVKLEGGAALEELSELERYQLNMQAAIYARMLDNAFYQYRQRMLDAEQWQSLRRGLLHNVSVGAASRYMRPTFEMMLPIVSAEFAGEIANVLREADAASGGEEAMPT